MSKILIALIACCMLAACEDWETDVRGTHFSHPPKPAYQERPYHPPLLVIPGSGDKCDGVVQPDGLCLIEVFE